ncbi:hypothetical protein BGX31_001303, partial [Mortierella sp. GBA43]
YHHRVGRCQFGQQHGNICSGMQQLCAWCHRSHWRIHSPAFAERGWQWMDVHVLGIHDARWIRWIGLDGRQGQVLATEGCRQGLEPGL